MSATTVTGPSTPASAQAPFRFWPLAFVVLVGALLVATWLRFTRGLGATTNLSDQFPWGLWIGFDVLARVGLAAGAFTLAGAVHIFNLKRFEPIVRPTLFTGFLCYLMVMAGLLFELGQPWRVWHTLIFWNPHSVLFEVAWCVMLYTSVMLLELSPLAFERLGWKRPIRLIHAVYTPIVIAGVLLSTLHQSSLGSLYLIVPSKLHPLWYSPLLPALFFLSAIAAGLGVVILEFHLFQRAYGRRLPMALLEPVGRVMAVVLVLYGLLRLITLYRSGAVLGLRAPTYEAGMFLFEIGVGVVVPALLLFVTPIRADPRGLAGAALLTVLGFVANRLNVSVTGMEASAGGRYIPSFIELTVSVGLVALGFGLFALAVRFLPIFPASETATDPEEA